jgi:hypothetical protein
LGIQDSYTTQKSEEQIKEEAQAKEIVDKVDEKK